MEDEKLIGGLLFLAVVGGAIVLSKKFKKPPSGMVTAPFPEGGEGVPTPSVVEREYPIPQGNVAIVNSYIKVEPI